MNPILSMSLMLVSGDGAARAVAVQSSSPMNSFDDRLPDYIKSSPPGLKPLEPAVLTLVMAIYRHDPDTLAHSWRVAGLCVYLYRRLLAEGQRKVPLDDLYSAALLHDIGKVTVPSDLLQAPRSLQAEERTLVQKHAAEGGRMLQSLRGPLKALACSLAVSHHECWNGSGYPVGLPSRLLPLHCRIAGLMDVFDALASPRAYKPGWPLDKLVALFVAQAGKQFDPKLINRLAPYWTSLLQEHGRLMDITLDTPSS